jgi:hypothetical protein
MSKIRRTGHDTTGTSFEACLARLCLRAQIIGRVHRFGAAGLLTRLCCSSASQCAGAAPPAPGFAVGCSVRGTAEVDAANVVVMTCSQSRCPSRRLHSAAPPSRTHVSSTSPTATLCGAANSARLCIAYAAYTVLINISTESRSHQGHNAFAMIDMNGEDEA